VTGFRDGDCYFLAGSGFECGNSHDRCLVIGEDPDVSSLSCTSAELERMLCCLSDSIEFRIVHFHLGPFVVLFDQEIERSVNLRSYHDTDIRRTCTNNGYGEF